MTFSPIRCNSQHTILAYSNGKCIRAFGFCKSWRKICLPRCHCIGQRRLRILCRIGRIRFLLHYLINGVWFSLVYAIVLTLPFPIFCGLFSFRIITKRQRGAFICIRLLLWLRFNTFRRGFWLLLIGYAFFRRLRRLRSFNRLFRLGYFRFCHGRGGIVPRGGRNTDQTILPQF